MPEGGWPVIVFVRGSTFHEQNVTDYSNYFVRIAEQGYVVAALKYRHSDIAPFPAQMQDCKTACVSCTRIPNASIATRIVLRCGAILRAVIRC